ncbi:hypothetical protein [Xylophilus sp. Leaf220]|uniref:NfrA family protein n=1 Tax=Xylophilus sp. Leaf220 TaxID=1735686 RepID=UPI0006F306EA|nr:hypothetical protein [Xylophilus sp. Leaf220]KQM70198.1 hypothetical protein ASE76_10355 [Xylophilus sp. Leaf220]
MTRLSKRTILAIALAAVWPVAPAFAAASQHGLQPRDGSQDQDPPLRLALSYRMTMPAPPVPAPSTPQEPAPVAQLPREPVGRESRSSEAASVLNARPDQLPPVPDLSAFLPPSPALRPSTSLAPPPRAVAASPAHPDAGTWGTGPADAVVNAADERLPLLSVALYPLPAAPVPARGPAPPLRIEQAPRDTRADDQRAARLAMQPRSVPVLRGRAWQLADQGYKAYNRNDFKTALARADAALRLRPDVARLHQLRVYALQKLGRLDEAALTAERAIDQGYTSPELREALVNLRPITTDAAGVQTTEAYRKGFPIATQAYVEYNDAQYAAAAITAEKAVRTDPSQGTWVLLWFNALENQQRYQDLIQAGAVALALGAPNKDEIMARMRLARQSIAVQHAQAAYQAMTRNRPQEAVKDAREAVRLAPDVGSHQLLLISVLQATQDLAGAEQAATEALEIDSEATAIQVHRAYLRQLLGRSDGAQQDIDAVLGHDWVDEAQRRNARLIGADMALAARNPARALALLAPLPPDDPQAQARRKQAGGATGWWSAPAVLAVTAYAPMQICRDTPYGTACELEPWDAPGTDNPSARAYAAYGQQRYPEAIALARKAVAEQPDNEANQNLLTTALASGTPFERRESLERLNVALAAKPADATLLRQRGYLQIANKQPALALQDFVAARATGDAPPTNVLDEAYATAGTGNRPAAAAMLRQAIDDADAGKLALDPQQRFDTRSAIANYSRDWGVNATVSYRGARSASNGLVGQPVSVPGNAVFSTTEVFWRPSDFLNSTSTTFDVYGRLSNALHAGTNVTGPQTVDNPCGGTISVAEQRGRGIAGLPSTTGALGVRYTPDTETNLTFGLERQFLLGTAARSGSVTPGPADLRCQLNNQAAALDYKTDAGSGGWQAYVLYGFYEGTGLRLDTTSWFTMEGYLQAGYTMLDTPVAYRLRDASGNVLGTSDGKLKRGQGFAAGEVRIGRSFVSDYSDRLVFFPHVSVAADAFSNRNRVSGAPIAGFNSFGLADNGSTWSAGAGVGVNLRYWLNEDRYNAQRSHVDTSLQYRTSLGGQADRAKGVFLSFSVAY